MSLAKKSVELLKEVAFCSAENLPPYNDEGVRVVLEEITAHNQLMSSIISKTTESFKTSLQAQGRPAETPMNWEQYPSQAAAIIVHHTTILRNKRVLLIYGKERAERLKQLRWKSRRLPEDVRANLSANELQFFREYDRLLNRYMRKGDEGVGMDLTLDLYPPKHPSQQVICIRDGGEVAMSTATFQLTKGSMHFMSREDADPLVAQGVLRYLDLDVNGRL